MLSDAELNGLEQFARDEMSDPSPSMRTTPLTMISLVQELRTLRAKLEMAEQYANKDCWAMFEKAWEERERGMGGAMTIDKLKSMGPAGCDPYTWQLLLDVVKVSDDYAKAYRDLGGGVDPWLIERTIKALEEHLVS